MVDEAQAAAIMMNADPALRSCCRLDHAAPARLGDPKSPLGQPVSQRYHRSTRLW
jgi:hypothetical protein